MCRRDFSKVIGGTVGLAARGEDAAANKPSDFSALRLTICNIGMLTMA
jgi:hypothetical protein